MDVNISEDSKVLANKLKGGGKPLAKEAVKLVTFRLEKLTKKNIKKSIYSTTPSEFYRRTGKAQQSITASILADLEGRVYMGVNYGKFLEEGTGIPAGRTGWYTKKSNLEKGAEGVIYMKGMKARPFWLPAKEEVVKELAEIIEKATEKILKKK